MNEIAVKKWLKGHEGFEDKVYLCTNGVPTGGWGHAFLEGSAIPLEVAQIFFQLDYAQAKVDLHKLIDLYKLPNLGPVRQAVLIGMLFQLGLTKVMKFEKMIAALQLKDFKLAAQEMRNSNWAKQTPARVTEAATMMLTGKIS